MPSKSSFSKSSKGKSNHGGARAGAGRKPKSLSVQGNQVTNFASFEGSQRTYTSRSWIYMPTTNPKQEFVGYDRMELLRKSRWFYNNVGIAARAIDGIARYAAPLTPQVRTSNRAWNKKAEQLFADAACTAAFGVDIAGEVNFADAQSFLLKHMALDGDVFWQKMLSKNDRGMFRIIGGESIGNSSYLPDEIQSEWADGVQSDKFGRAINYSVMDATDPQKATIVSANDLHQIKRHYRRGYHRSPSWLARACNHLQDLSEITSYTKESIKLNSQIAFVITSPEAGQIGLGSQRKKLDLGELGQITTDQLWNASGIPHLKPGERLESHQSNAPGTNLDSFLSFLIRDCAWSIGLSPEVLWSIAGIGGANTRFVLEDANNFFAEVQGIIREQFCRPFWTYWVWQEIEAGRLEHPGDDWWRCDWIAPKAPSVDIGRDGKLHISLVQSGLMSRRRYFGMLGLDVDDETDDMIADAKDLKEKCEEAGIAVTDIIPPAPGSSQVQQEPDANDTDAQNAPTTGTNMSRFPHLF